jgi:hypothetical protein
MNLQFLAAGTDGTCRAADQLSNLRVWVLPQQFVFDRSPSPGTVVNLGDALQRSTTGDREPCAANQLGQTFISHGPKQTLFISCPRCLEKNPELSPAKPDADNASSELLGYFLIRHRAKQPVLVLGPPRAFGVLLRDSVSPTFGAN